MCTAASFVVTKDKVFHSIYTDSHENIIKEFGLCESNGRYPNVIRVEIIPNARASYSYFSDVSLWDFVVDQEAMPDWFDGDLKELERRVRLELPRWLQAKVFTAGDWTVGPADKIWVGGRAHVFIDAPTMAVVSGHGSVTVRSPKCHISCTEHGHVYMYREGSIAYMYDKSVGEIREGFVEARGKTTIRAEGASVIHAYDNAKVTAFDNATVFMYGDSVGFGYNDSRFEVNDKAQVSLAHRSSVKLIKGSQAVVTLQSPNAVAHMMSAEETCDTILVPTLKGM